MKSQHPIMLRPATIDDLSLIASWIGTPQDCTFWAGSAMPYPLRLETLPAELKFSPNTSYCMELDGSVAAFGQLAQRTDGRGHLSRIIVSPHLRGKSLGRKLILELLALATEKGFDPVGLYVAPENDVAVALYSSLGFLRADRPDCIAASPGSCYLVR